ncbi:MAG: tetratricopeptide repeat protein, partial [Candidatus Heimdallarchaeota archaeon]|nr:tetratricopeptide repeat protein [Candidatus Heimdallarchaeota archaeon]
MENQLSEKISNIDHLIYKGKNDEALEEIKKLEKKKIDKETKLSLLIFKSKLKYRLGKYEKALTFADTAAKTGKKLVLPLQELEALILKISTLLSLNRYEEVFKIIKKGERKLDSISNHLKEKKSKEGDLLYLLGEYYRHKDEYDKALDYHMQGLKIRQKIENKQNIAYSMIGIGRALWRKGELEQALDYSEKSLKIHKKIGNKRDIAVSLTHIGLIHSGKGESDKALEYYKQCIKISEELGDRMSVAGVIGFSAIIHLRRGELDKALEYYKQCIKIYEELENRKDVAHVLHNIAGIHLRRGEL